MPPDTPPPEGTPAPESAPAAAPSEPTTTAAPTAPAQPEGLDRIYERMDQLAAQQQEIATQFGTVFAPPEEEMEYYDDDGEMTEEGVRAVVSDYVREQVDAQLAPREAQALIVARDDEWEALKESYPELEDRAVAQGVIAEAVRWAQTHNPDLIDRPEFVDVIEWAYRSHKFDEHAEAQAAAAPQGVVLESASGARQDVKGQVDWQKRVMDAAEQSAPRI